MQVRRAVLGDEPILRWLRLEALTDTPHAFGSTLERERARTPEDWQRWIDPGPVWLLEDDDTPLGMAGVIVRADGPAELVAVWVHEEARGSGGADLLVQAALDWAVTEGHPLELHVTEGNERAERFYRRMGFELTGVAKPRDHDGAVERQMLRAGAR